jgi:hypothetical protein
LMLLLFGRRKQIARVVKGQVIDETSRYRS